MDFLLVTRTSYKLLFALANITFIWYSFHIDRPVFTVEIPGVMLTTMMTFKVIAEIIELFTESRERERVQEEESTCSHMLRMILYFATVANLGHFFASALFFYAPFINKYFGTQVLSFPVHKKYSRRIYGQNLIICSCLGVIGFLINLIMLQRIRPSRRPGGRLGAKMEILIMVFNIFSIMPFIVANLENLKIFNSLAIWEDAHSTDIAIAGVALILSLLGSTVFFSNDFEIWICGNGFFDRIFVEYKLLETLGLSMGFALIQRMNPPVFLLTASFAYLIGILSLAAVENFDLMGFKKKREMRLHEQSQRSGNTRSNR